jgi:hypothetical protein
MMSDDRSWNDDDRPSWREIDKMRENSSQRREEKPEISGNKSQQAYATTHAKRAADALFHPKKVAAQAVAEKKLQTAKGTDGFEAAAAAFFEDYGVTDDWHIQLLLAECNKASIAVPAIEALAAKSDVYDTTEKRNVVAQLKVLAMTGKMKVKKAAKEALSALE